MTETLIFDSDWLTPEQIQLDGKTINYLAAHDIQYVQHPVAAI
ncbi:hypothetical protein [Lactiplantibacillus pentosus]